MNDNAIDVQLTSDDYLAANILHWRWNRQILIVALGVIVVGAIPYFANSFVNFDSDVLIPVAIYIVFVMLVLAGCRYLLIPWRTRRLFRQTKSLQRPQHISWSEAGLAVRGEGFSSEASWSDYLKWRESKQMFSIYLSDLMFRIIPKRDFRDNQAIEEFRDLLRRKIAPKQGHKRRL